MKAGDLVKWSHAWIAGSPADKKRMYIGEIGILTKESLGAPCCLLVAWNDGRLDEVHKHYLVLL